MNDTQLFKKWVAGLPDDVAIEIQASHYSNEWRPFDSRCIRAVSTIPETAEKPGNVVPGKRVETNER